MGSGNGDDGVKADGKVEVEVEGLRTESVRNQTLKTRNHNI